MTASRPDARRLAQIAQRKLTALGIPCEPSPDGGVLTGALPDAGAPIVHPLTAQPIRGIRFYVEGHDRLRWVAPPALAGLPPLEFYSQRDLDGLRAAIARAIEQRGHVVRGLRDRLLKLGFELSAGDALACVRARLDLELLGTLSVEADEDGLRLLECAPLVGGAPLHVGGRPLDLAEFNDPSDVEIELSTRVERARRRKPTRATSSPPRRRPRVLVQAPPGAASSLAWLLDVLGPDFFAAGVVALSRGLSVDGVPGRLELELREREVRRGRIYVQEELRWEGDVPLGQIVQLESFAARALEGAGERPPPASEPAAAAAPGVIPPAPGEVWVMDIEVEQEGADEIRYVGLNARGGRQGAPRILPRHTFEKVFLPHGLRHRMLVRVARVDGSRIAYQRLNAERQPVAAARELALEIFLATFVAEVVAD